MDTNDTNPSTQSSRPVINTAVILAGGAGSRTLRMTRVTEKPLLPIYAAEYTQATIDYAVKDCIAAGVSRILFITTERGSRQLKEYFEELNPVIKRQLERVGKHELINAEGTRDQAYGLKFEYIFQPAHTYGTAAALWCAREALANEENFIVMTGDDVTYNPDRRRSDLADAVAEWQAAGTDYLVTGKAVARNDAPKYGVFKIDDTGLFTGIDEKPPIERVPLKPIANVSRYIFSSKIWAFMEAEMNQDKGIAEHYIIDPISAALANGQSCTAHCISSDYVYLDCGSYVGLEYAGSYIKQYPPFDGLASEPSLTTAGK